MSFAPWLLLALFQGQVGTAAAPLDPSGFGYDVQLRPGEALRGYRWDHGAPVPFAAPDMLVRVPFGERGLIPGTRLYLPAHALVEGGASGATQVESSGITRIEDGRFGGALRFDPRSFLRYLLPLQDPDALGWTVSFWIRPEPAAFGHTLVSLPGSAEVVLQSDGRVRAALLPSGEQVTSTARLAGGAWSFVQLAHDPELLRELRLVVDGTPNLVPLAAPSARVATELWAGDIGRNGSGFAGAVDELAVAARAASTAGALAAFRPALRPGIHVLELTTSAGMRSVTCVAGATSEMVLDDEADFRGGALDGVAVARGGLRWTPGRWKTIATDDTPPPRTTHALVALPGQRVLTFGGETRDTHLGPMVNTSDTWILDGVANRWERVLGASGPSGRCHVPLAYSPDHDLVLLVGGWENDGQPGQVFDETWVFHVSERRWEQRFPLGSSIGRRSDHGLVYLPALRKFLLLQGRASCLYDPVANRWDTRPRAQVVDANGNPTTYATGGSPICALDPSDGTVLVFGGSYGPTQMDFPDTTAVYDVATNTYTVLDPPVRPTGRVRAGFAYDPRHRGFVLFGGVKDQYSLRHDDLWFFDPRRREWIELDCSNRPSPRGGYYGMAYDPVADRFVLHAGRQTPERWLDDTWSLELDWTRAGRALYTFDRIQSRRNNWSAQVTEPADARVTFLFRASENGTQWSRWTNSTAGLETQRFLQVVAFLHPGSNGEAPSIQSMGLR